MTSPTASLTLGSGGPAVRTGSGLLDVERVRADFPILSRTVRDGRALVYLDSGATSQKPNAVLDAERGFYTRHNAAVHRGAHQLAEEATDAYEGARTKIASFIGAQEREIVFAKNATEALNLVSYTFSNATAKAAHGAELPAGAERFVLAPGDEIVVTEMEHHANLVPWQEVCDKTGAVLRWIGMTDDGRLDLSTLDVITERTKVVALTHQSNVLGTVTPVAEVAAAARAVGALVVLDACQSVPHLPVDVRELGVDFLAFSGHKMVGPTGIGVLWGRYELLDSMPPFLTGGSMIELVRMERSTFAPPPQRFEAGRADGGAGRRASAPRSTTCTRRRHDDRGAARTSTRSRRTRSSALAEIPGVRIIGPTGHRRPRGGGVLRRRRHPPPRRRARCSTTRGSRYGSGHHCAWPLHRGVRRAGDDARDVLPLQPGPRTWTPSWRRCAHAQDVLRGEPMNLESLYQEIILDHYKRPTAVACASRTTPRSTT